MSEPTPSRRPRAKKDEVIEDAVIVEDATVQDTAVVEPVAAQPVELVEPVQSADQPVTVAEPAPEPAPAPEPTPAVAPEPVYVSETSNPQVVYVHTPAPPARKGNRGVGAAIAVASGLIFFAAFAVATAFISLAQGGGFTFNFLAQATFYLPTLFFIIGFVLLVLLANRANWWAYIFGSILVALFVYFGTIGSVMLANGAILRTPEEAAQMFEQGLVDPVVIVATLIAREVSLWTGSLIARRGRRVTVRNAEARQAWEREVAETRAEYERTYPGSTAS